MCEAYHIEIWKGSFGDYALSLGRVQKNSRRNNGFYFVFHIIMKSTQGPKPKEDNTEIVVRFMRFSNRPQFNVTSHSIN